MNQDFHTRLRLLACSFNNSIEVAQDQILLRTCLLRTRRFCSGPNICSGLVLRTKYLLRTCAQDQIFAQDLCSGLVLRTKYLLRTCAQDQIFAQDLCSGPNIAQDLFAQDQILLRTYLLRTKYLLRTCAQDQNDLCSGQ